MFHEEVPTHGSCQWKITIKKMMEVLCDASTIKNQFSRLVQLNVEDLFLSLWVAGWWWNKFLPYHVAPHQTCKEFFRLVPRRPFEKSPQWHEVFLDGSQHQDKGKCLWWYPLRVVSLAPRRIAFWSPKWHCILHTCDWTLEWYQSAAAYTVNTSHPTLALWILPRATPAPTQLVLRPSMAPCCPPTVDSVDSVDSMTLHFEPGENKKTTSANLPSAKKSLVFLMLFDIQYQYELKASKK